MFALLLENGHLHPSTTNGSQCQVEQDVLTLSFNIALKEEPLDVTRERPSTPKKYMSPEENDMG